MDSEVPGEITRLLRRVDAGDRKALGDLLPLVYEELRAIANGYMQSERCGHTLQPTALVNEAWLRLAKKERPEWIDRRHFYRAAAAVMRCILISHARRQKSLKRGGQSKRIPLDDAVAAFEEQGTDLLALHDALTRLEAIDDRQASLVELRFFAGLTISETAEVLGVSERTVHADWSLARAWLMREMDGA